MRYHIAMHSSRPSTLFMQKHWDVMRSDDASDLLRIQAAVDEYRRERQANVLIRQTSLALAAAVGLLLFWFLGVRIVRILIRVLEHRYKSRMRELGIQSLKLSTNTECRS